MELKHDLINLISGIDTAIETIRLNIDDKQVILTVLNLLEEEANRIDEKYN